MAEGLRFMAGIHPDGQDTINQEVPLWSYVKTGPHLQEILAELRTSCQKTDQTVHTILSEHLHAQLRPYQLQGVYWLWTLYHLRLGGCLADDMGLGKTIQILSLLLLIQQKVPGKTHLLIVPASLLGNWLAEIKRFASGLKYIVMHSSEGPIDPKRELNVQNIDVVITTYGLSGKLPNLFKIDWDVLIIDEAQAIKNPRSQQTHTVKNFKARVKFALTGTPIENSLSDLWSLFDFVAPGLLGSGKQFAQLNKAESVEQKQHFHSVIQQLISPYILRRLKSDKHVIDDLPDKTELLVRCNLTKHQAVLYQQSVDELASILESGVGGIKRQGLVLSYLMRLKQICNHPNQWLGHNQYDEKESGKFIQLQELCNIIAQKNERILVFTQFREMVPILSTFLASIFGRLGLELHGATAIKKRAGLVAEFQKEDGPPFFVLSLKAGGTGLNLTKASHVIHFDRWWNPAVENQATDRAYRIGQKRNVLVHKFICSGTIEEKIDEIIFRKRELVDTIIKSGCDVTLSDLNDAQLLNILSLDINRAIKEDELLT